MIEKQIMQGVRMIDARCPGHTASGRLHSISKSTSGLLLVISDELYLNEGYVLIITVSLRQVR